MRLSGRRRRASRSTMACCNFERAAHRVDDAAKLSYRRSARSPPTRQPPYRPLLRPELPNFRARAPSVHPAHKSRSPYVRRTAAAPRRALEAMLPSTSTALCACEGSRIDAAMAAGDALSNGRRTGAPTGAAVAFEPKRRSDVCETGRLSRGRRASRIVPSAGHQTRHSLHTECLVDLISLANMKLAGYDPCCARDNRAALSTLTRFAHNPRRELKHGQIFLFGFAVTH